LVSALAVLLAGAAMASTGATATAATSAGPGAAMPGEAVIALAPPPAASSRQAADELAELHAIARHRTAAERARAIADDHEESIFAFADAIGAPLTPAALPLTAHLSELVGREEEKYTEPLKLRYGRARPYNADPSLQPICKTRTTNDSYPSGHATAGWLQALTLVELVPARRIAILARAREYARNRLVCGVHYRSDIDAGELLAKTVFLNLKTQPSFQRDLTAARAELQALLRQNIARGSASPTSLVMSLSSP
jgi:acid phosphatase (class A)